MRHLILVAALPLALVLAGAAQAGGDCPYSKSGAVAASAESKAAAGATACAESCPHAKEAAVASSCGCKGGKQAGETMAEETGAGSRKPSASADRASVASND